MESLLEPFEPPPEKKPLPVGPMCFGLAAAAAVIWLGVLAWRMSSPLSAAEASPRGESGLIDYQAAQHAAEAQRAAAARQRALRAILSGQPAPELPFLPPDEPIVVRPPTRADVQVRGGSAWDRPMPTSDGSYFGQIDPTTGLPKTVYQSDPSKYVVDTARLPRRSSGGDARGPRVYAPESTPLPDDTAGNTTGGKPHYYQFDKAPDRVR